VLLNAITAPELFHVASDNVPFTELFFVHHESRNAKKPQHIRLEIIDVPAPSLVGSRQFFWLV
jgi:hypothetical protein